MQKKRLFKSYNNYALILSSTYIVSKLKLIYLVVDD